MYGMEEKSHPGWKCQERDGQETSEDTATAFRKTLGTFTMDVLISTKIKVVTDLADWFLCELHVYVDKPDWLCRHWKIDLIFQKNFCLSNSPRSTWMLWWSFRVFLMGDFFLYETLNKSS